MLRCLRSSVSAHLRCPKLPMPLSLSTRRWSRDCSSGRRLDHRTARHGDTGVRDALLQESRLMARFSFFSALRPNQAPDPATPPITCAMLLPVAKFFYSSAPE